MNAKAVLVDEFSREFQALPTFCFLHLVTIALARATLVVHVSLIYSRTYSVSAKKEQILLFCSRLFVTLEEIAGFLYIKAMQRIEKIQGYDLETILASRW